MHAVPIPMYLLWLAALLFAGLFFLAANCWWQCHAQNGPPTEPMEDAIKHIHALRQSQDYVSANDLAAHTGQSVSSSENTVRQLIQSGWARRNARDGIRRTARGEQRARELVRAHRLWERYLADTKGVPLDKLHEAAEKQEHHITPEMADQLDDELGHPLRDPHGDYIPDKGEEAIDSVGQPLSNWALLRPAQVIHVEDEPPALFAQLFAMGFLPGVEVVVHAKDDTKLLVTRNNDRMVLAPIAAANISVVPTVQRGIPLARLNVGESGTIIQVGGNARAQRRFLDMGIVPGGRISVIRTAPLGDPVEYRVKGSNISLRRAETANILIEPINSQEKTGTNV